MGVEYVRTKKEESRCPAMTRLFQGADQSVMFGENKVCAMRHTTPVFQGQRAQRVDHLLLDVTRRVSWVSG